MKKCRGPFGEDLPQGLTYDHVKKRFRIQPAPGMKRESVGPHKGRALRLLAQRRKEIKDGKRRPRAQRASTLNALAGHWFDSQDPEAVPSLKRNFNQYELHIAPHLGTLKPDDVRPPELLEVLLMPYRAGELAAASVHNLRGTLSSMYEHGRFHEFCDSNPCTRLRKKLPSKRNQKRPTYSDSEVAVLLHDPRIADDWRTFYALQAFAGMRCGEAAGLRWSDLDFKAPILGSLFIHCQYNDRPLKTATGDDGKERVIPMHPMLGTILRKWKLGGFAARYGRLPTDSDRIVPDARSMAALTYSVIDKRLRRVCPTVDVPLKGTHGLRRFFITYTRRGGATPDVLERVTHNAKGGIIDTYTDSGGMWPRLCDAVQCLSAPTLEAPRTLIRTLK